MNKTIEVESVQKVFVTKKTLCEMFEIGATFFDEYFGCDPRMKSCEYRKGKTFLRYEYSRAKKYMTEIFLELMD